MSDPARRGIGKPKPSRRAPSTSPSRAPVAAASVPAETAARLAAAYARLEEEEAEHKRRLAAIRLEMEMIKTAGDKPSANTESSSEDFADSDEEEAAYQAGMATIEANRMMIEEEEKRKGLGHSPYGICQCWSCRAFAVDISPATIKEYASDIREMTEERNRVARENAAAGLDAYGSPLSPRKAQRRAKRR